MDSNSNCYDGDGDTSGASYKKKFLLLAEMNIHGWKVKLRRCLCEKCAKTADVVIVDIDTTEFGTTQYTQKAEENNWYYIFDAVAEYQMQQAQEQLRCFRSLGHHVS